MLQQRFPRRTPPQQEDLPLAQRVIQFPVRNAFAAQRSRDALARETEVRDAGQQAERIAGIVDNELARTAERLASGRNTGFENARNRGVVVMPIASQAQRLRRKLALLGTKLFSY